jgi:hypothetical protein
MAEIRATADYLDPGSDGVGIRNPISIPFGGAPLPDIANTVIKPKSVGIERRDGCCTGIAVLTGIQDRKFALPSVASMASIGSEDITPGISCLV